MTVRTIRIEASSAEELRQKAERQNIEMLPGSIGRVEIYGKRVLGVCVIPLGEAMKAPWAGQKFADALAPAGAVVTDRGGLGGWGPDCDGYLEWEIPASMGQGVTMALGPIAVVVVIGAIAGAIALLGWAISQIRATIQVVTEAAGPVFPVLVVGAAILAVGLGLTIIRGPTRRRT